MYLPFDFLASILFTFNFWKIDSRESSPSFLHSDWAWQLFKPQFTPEVSVLKHDKLS
jgi:hypothetical protein